MIRLFNRAHRSQAVLHTGQIAFVAKELARKDSALE